MKIVTYLLFILLLNSFFVPLQGKSIDFDYEIVVPESLQIGTLFKLIAEFITPVDNEVYFPIRDTLNIYIITDVQSESANLSSTQKRTTLTYRLAPFDTGYQELTSLTFDVYNPDTQEMKQFKTEPHFFSIASVLADTSRVLKDIAPPMKIRYSFWDYALLFSIIIFTLVIVFFVIRKLIKKSEKSFLQIRKDLPPPYLQALEMLEVLKAQKLLENGNFLEYHYRLSYILRFFLELQFCFNAVEMTTQEIEYKLKTVIVAGKEDLISFLRETDLVKFAKFNPGVDKPLQQTKWLEQYLRSFSAQPPVSNGIKWNGGTDV